MRLPNHLTVREAALELCTSEKRILAMIAQGTLKAVNIGQGKTPRWAIPREGAINTQQRPVRTLETKVTQYF